MTLETRREYRLKMLWVKGDLTFLKSGASSLIMLINGKQVTKKFRRQRGVQKGQGEADSGREL